jgi:hypothetical protein
MHTRPKSKNTPLLEIQRQNNYGSTTSVVIERISAPSTMSDPADFAKNATNTMVDNNDAFNVLPNEIILRIFLSLDFKSILNILKTNRRLNTVASDNEIWSKFADQILVNKKYTTHEQIKRTVGNHKQLFFNTFRNENSHPQYPFDSPALIGLDNLMKSGDKCTGEGHGGGVCGCGFSLMASLITSCMVLSCCMSNPSPAVACIICCGPAFVVAPVGYVAGCLTNQIFNFYDESAKRDYELSVNQYATQVRSFPGYPRN